MTMRSNPSEQWVAFQRRVTDAISEGAAGHDTLGELLAELRRCEVALRRPSEDISMLSGPVASELTVTLRRYEEDGRPGSYDAVCAANVVLESMNTLVRSAQEVDR